MKALKPMPCNGGLGLKHACGAFYNKRVRALAKLWLLFLQSMLLCGFVSLHIPVALFDGVQTFALSQTMLTCKTDV